MRRVLLATVAALLVLAAATSVAGEVIETVVVRTHDGADAPHST